MKKQFFSLLLILLCSAILPAQEHVALGGHGSHEPKSTICVTPEQRVIIAQDLENSRDELIARGLLDQEHKSGGGGVLMAFPLAKDPSLDWNGVHAVSGYVDQDASSIYMNYYCDYKTYDGHMGTDYYLWPFDHHLMDNQLAWVVAAAPGTIIYKHDGEFDQQCEWQSGVTWNAIYVEHSDGTIAWYGHMKSGTLTSKAVGQTVAVGEYIGAVGSSGYSSGPHLHFELHNADNSLIDPYFGTCNSTDFSSTWIDQDPYLDMKLNTILTHSAVPEFGCPSVNEDPHFESYFSSFETVFLAAYFKEQAAGEIVNYRIRRPNGTLYDSWSHSSPDDYIYDSYWYWTITVPVGEVAGTWQFEADHDGITQIREFYVNMQPSGLNESTIKPLALFPNPAQDMLAIDWPEGIAKEQGSIAILDAQGKIVLVFQLEDLKENQNMISLAKLAPGLYLVRLYSADDVYSGSLIKE